MNLQRSLEINLRINKEIKADKVRVIGIDGSQVGIILLKEALEMSIVEGVDLVEIVPKSNPPVCKVIDYGKYRYEQTKREKENKKAQHQIKVKEIKFKPNIDKHDFDYKVDHAKKFLEQGNKVKITCMFRGRELAHPEIGHSLVKDMCQRLQDVSNAETMPRLLGRFINVVLMPKPRKK